MKFVNLRPCDNRKFRTSLQQIDLKTRTLIQNFSLSHGFGRALTTDCGVSLLRLLVFELRSNKVGGDIRRIASSWTKAVEEEYLRAGVDLYPTRSLALERRCCFVSPAALAAAGDK